MRSKTKGFCLRLSDETDAALTALADRDKIPRTAVVENLIASAAEGHDSYYLQLAAAHSFLASTTALYLAYHLTKNPEGLVNQITTSATDLFGDLMPRPPSLVAKSSVSPLAASLINAYRKII